MATLDHDSPIDVSADIHRLVRAVRSGNDRRIAVLLRRFTQHADMAALYRLRDALLHDA
ncbi:hypothetical protein [Streptomyces acidiscabies]|uniref:hypothetical protein n=1 Tax=Streptomyces acidiscabies TaxID=42234 RepID=UPI0015BB34C8|nr:hypothetical protein [Streptomyces acidiscabies]